MTSSSNDGVLDEKEFFISPSEMAKKDIYPLLFIGAGRCGLTTLTHFPENRQRASLVVDRFGGWLESWADRAMRLGMTHVRYPITQTPFASSSMAIQSFSSRMGRNEELAYSGSDKFAPLPSTRLYAEACARKIQSDEDGGILKSVPNVRDEVVNLRKIEANEEYPGLLKRGGMLAKTKGGKEFVAAQVVVCCARKEAVVPEKLKAFVVKDGGNGRVKTSESINVFDPEGTLNGKRLLVVGGGMTAASVASGAVENSKVKSVTLLHRKSFKRREFDVEPEYFGAKGLRPFHNSEDFEYRAKFIDEAKERGTINGVTWKRVRSHSVASKKKTNSSTEQDGSSPKLRVVEKAEIVSIGFDETTKQFSTTIELTDVAKRELAAKRARSIIEVDADDDFQALTMTVEEASYETPKVEVFDEIWICCGTAVSAKTDPLLSSLPKTNYFNGYPQLVETTLSWEHGPNEVSLAKENGGCRWPRCSVFVSGRYAALHVGPVASLPLGYRTAGKEIAAISTKSHKQSLRMRAENPYEIGLGTFASETKTSSSSNTSNRGNALEDKSKTNKTKNPRLPPVLWQKVGIIDVSKLLPSENFPRVDLQTYSHEDVGFQIKIYFILPEEIESENVKMEFLEQAFEIWAVCAKAAYRVFLPKLYKTIIPERSSVRVIAKKRKIIVTMQKYDNYEWRFLKV